MSCSIFPKNAISIFGIKIQHSIFSSWNGLVWAHINLLPGPLPIWNHQPGLTSTLSLHIFLRSSMLLHEIFCLILSTSVTAPVKNRYLITGIWSESRNSTVVIGPTSQARLFLFFKKIYTSHSSTTFQINKYFYPFSLKMLNFLKNGLLYSHVKQNK